MGVALGLGLGLGPGPRRREFHPSLPPSPFPLPLYPHSVSFRPSRSSSTSRMTKGQARQQAALKAKLEKTQKEEKQRIEKRTAAMAATARAATARAATAGAGAKNGANENGVGAEAKTGPLTWCAKCGRKHGARAACPTARQNTREKKGWRTKVGRDSGLGQRWRLG